MANIVFNLLSKKTSVRLIVIESDDWGSLRSETLEQRKALNNINSFFARDPYLQLDGLADKNDREALLNHRLNRF